MRGIDAAGRGALAGLAEERIGELTETATCGACGRALPARGAGDLSDPAIHDVDCPVPALARALDALDLGAWEDDR